MNDAGTYLGEFPIENSMDNQTDIKNFEAINSILKTVNIDKDCHGQRIEIVDKWKNRGETNEQETKKEVK